VTINRRVARPSHGSKIAGHRSHPSIESANSNVESSDAATAVSPDRPDTFFTNRNDSSSRTGRDFLQNGTIRISRSTHIS
jgi:hypothetical protein